MLGKTKVQGYISTSCLLFLLGVARISAYRNQHSLAEKVISDISDAKASKDQSALSWAPMAQRPNDAQRVPPLRADHPRAGMFRRFRQGFSKNEPRVTLQSQEVPQTVDIAGPNQEAVEDPVFLKHILNHATAGDPESVLKAVDDYAWSLDESHYVMNIGDTKGKILDSVVSEKQPRLAVEFGTYLGYSAARIARLLPQGGRLISVDTWPGAGAAAAVLLEKAGLSSRVELRTEGSTETLYDLVGAGEKIDLLFLDHDKDQYLHDLQLAISLGVLADGCAIVADKIRFPFTLDYYNFVTHQSAFKTTIHDTLLEYHKQLGDEVLVSTYDEQKRNQTGLLTGRTWLGEPDPSDSEAELLNGTDSEFDNFLDGLRVGAQGETEPEWESL